MIDMYFRVRAYLRSLKTTDFNKFVIRFEAGSPSIVQWNYRHEKPTDDLLRSIPEHVVNSEKNEIYKQRHQTDIYRYMIIHAQTPESTTPYTTEPRLTVVKDKACSVIQDKKILIFKEGFYRLTITGVAADLMELKLRLPGVVDDVYKQSHKGAFSIVWLLQTRRDDTTLLIDITSLTTGHVEMSGSILLEHVF